MWLVCSTIESQGPFKHVTDSYSFWTIMAYLKKKEKETNSYYIKLKQP